MFCISSAVESYTRESIGSYDSCMRKMKSFKNPRSIHHLTKELGVTMKNSSLMSTLRDGFHKKDCYKNIRRTQLCRWAHKHVTEGIALHKKGDNTEAFQLLKKALSIDPENVEAFVAKGALSANLGNFQSALEDFQYALKYDPDHGNAKKYMCETLLALGRKFEEAHKLGSAEGCYLRCLKLDPEHRDCYKELCNLHDISGFKGSISKEVLRSMDPEKEIITVSTESDEDKLHSKNSPDSSPSKSNREGSTSPSVQRETTHHMNHSPPHHKTLGSSKSNSQSFSKKSVTVPKFVIGKCKGIEVVPAVCSNENRSSKITMDGEEIVNDIPVSQVPKSVRKEKPVVVEENDPVVLEENDPVVDDKSDPVVVDKVLIGDKVEISEPVSELQKSYETMLAMTPVDASEVQQFSMSLIILAKRFRYEGNVAQAKECLEKSLKYNPRHEATLSALMEISKEEKEKNALQNPVEESKNRETKIQSLSSISSVTAARPNPVPYFSSVPPPNYPGGANFGFNQNYYPEYSSNTGMYQFDTPPPNVYPSSSWSQPPLNTDVDYDAKVASFLERCVSRKNSDRSEAHKQIPKKSPLRSRNASFESGSDRSRSPVRSKLRRSPNEGRRPRSSHSRSSSRTRTRRKSNSKTRHKRDASPSDSKNGISRRRSRSSSKNSDSKRRKTEREHSSDSKVISKLSSVNVSSKLSEKTTSADKEIKDIKSASGKDSEKKKKADKVKRIRNRSSSSSSSSSDSSSSDSSLDKKSRRSKKKKKKETKDKKVKSNEAVIKGVDESFIKQLKESIRKDLEAEMKAKKKKSNKVSKSKEKETKKVKKDDVSSKSDTGDKVKSRKLSKAPNIEHKSPKHSDQVKAIEKAAGDTSINIKGIFEMPNLEDLQKKIKDFYSKVDSRKDAHSDETKSKKSEDSKQENTKSPIRAVKDGEEFYGPSYEDFIKEKEPSKSNMKQKEASRIHIKIKDSSRSNVASHSKSNAEPSKPNNDLKGEIAVSSGFKSTFKPVTPVRIEKDNSEEHRKKVFNEFISMHAYQGILTPQELKSGIKEQKIKQYEELVEKARKKAEAIGKTRTKFREVVSTAQKRKTRDSHSSGSQSRSRSRSKHSRSRGRRSRSRGRRSRSRSRHSRSRSRRSKSRSRRSRSRSRHSRSRSRHSRSRSRRSRSRSRHSRSRSRHSRSRSRSGSRNRSYHRHSRGRFQRRGYHHNNNRVYNRGRNFRGIFFNYNTSRDSHRRNLSRSVSRERSGSRGRRHSPDYSYRSRSRSVSSTRKQKRSRSRSSSLNKSSKKTKTPNDMFGKWAAEEDLKGANEPATSARRPFLQF